MQATMMEMLSSTMLKNYQYTISGYNWIEDEGKKTTGSKAEVDTHLKMSTLAPFQSGSEPFTSLILYVRLSVLAMQALQRLSVSKIGEGLDKDRLRESYMKPVMNMAVTPIFRLCPMLSFHTMGMGR